MDFGEYTMELAALVGINLIVFIFLLIINLINVIKIRNLKIKYNKFMSGSGETNLEGLLNEYIQKVNDVKSNNKFIENRLNYLENNIKQCTQKVGIIRYNAFDNVGSDLSYTVALLDDNDDGVVLSGIFSRDSSSTYAKPILSGKSKYILSSEEIQAIDIARKNYREKIASGQ